MDHLGPFLFNACRFALGFLSLLPVYFFLEGRSKRNIQQGSRSKKTYDRRLLRVWGPVTGVVLFMASSLQQVGLLYTTAGNSGFITGLYIILVPVLGMAMGHATRPATWLGGLLHCPGSIF